nr:NADH dehydrogenase subunit 5 [Pholas orientalis]
MFSKVNFNLLSFLCSFVILINFALMLLWFFFSFCVSKKMSLILDVDLSWCSGFNPSFMMVFDWSSLIFSLTVFTISSFVMVFSCFYMDHEKFSSRFSWLVMLFVFFMNFLIFVPSFVWMMVGWDGLGVVSFLLVIYYYNSDSLAAGMMTALVNRIGDALFILFISVTFFSMSWHFFDFWVQLSFALVSFLVVGSMTKSAQVPFSAWLPAAMAAPTPVSALVHSSTLVTAGVYVLFRFSDCLEGFWLVLLGVLSMMTLLMAGFTASCEVDLKKVVAFSTLSQLGVMMLALSIGMKDVCFFHLITHAFFKALMFLCVGGIIYLSGGSQDSRFFSGLWYKCPLIWSWLVVCCFSLMGMPFMAGFYSKDLVIEGCVFSSFSFMGMIMVYFSVFLTALYSFLLMFKVGFTKSFMSKEGYSSNNNFLSVSLFGLGGGAIFSGIILQKSIENFNYFTYVSSTLKIFPLVLIFCGFLVAFFFNYVLFNKWMSCLSVLKGLNSLSSFSFFSFSGAVVWLTSKMWFLPNITGNMFSSFSLKFLNNVYKVLEKGFIESLIWKQVVPGKMRSFKLDYSGFKKSNSYVGWFSGVIFVGLVVFMLL